MLHSAPECSKLSWKESHSTQECLECLLFNWNARKLICVCFGKKTQYGSETLENSHYPLWSYSVSMLPEFKIELLIISGDSDFSLFLFANLTWPFLILQKKNLLVSPVPWFLQTCNNDVWVHPPLLLRIWCPNCKCQTFFWCRCTDYYWFSLDYYIGSDLGRAGSLPSVTFYKAIKLYSY